VHATVNLRFMFFPLMDLLQILSCQSQKSNIQTRAERDWDDVSNLCSLRKASTARSPMMMQGAMVLPVVTSGMMEPSAIRVNDGLILQFRLAASLHLSSVDSEVLFKDRNPPRL